MITRLLISTVQHLSEVKWPVMSAHPMYFLLRQMAAIVCPIGAGCMGGLKSKDALLRPSTSPGCHSVPRLWAEEPWQ